MISKQFFTLFAGLLISSATISPGAVLITQYYEGTSFNKWLELTNLGTETADLGTITVTLWSNTNTEEWRSGGSPNTSLTLSGTLGSGATLLLSHASAVEPAYAASDIQSSGVINFNGDDSIVIYDGALDAANIVDALSFTDAGSEGQDTSIVRTSNAQGYSLTTAGGTFQDFPAVWSNIGTAAADGAAPGTNERLGESTVDLIPEPNFALLGALGLLFLLRRRK